MKKKKPISVLNSNPMNRHLLTSDTYSKKGVYVHLINENTRPKIVLNFGNVAVAISKTDFTDIVKWYIKPQKRRKT